MWGLDHKCQELLTKIFRSSSFVVSEQLVSRGVSFGNLAGEREVPEMSQWWITTEKIN